APSLRHHNPALPPCLETVLRRALAKEPEARYATATDLANALSERAALEPQKSTLRTVRATAGELPRIRPRARHPRAMALGLVCVLALGAGAWAAFRRAPDVPRITASRSDVTPSVEPQARPVIPTVAAPADPEPSVAKAPAQAPAPAPAQALGCLSVNAL